MFIKLKKTEITKKITLFMHLYIDVAEPHNFDAAQDSDEKFYCGSGPFAALLVLLSSVADPYLYGIFLVGCGRRALFWCVKKP
jgi:hypothetical protein